MISYLLTGVLLGAVLTLIGVYIFTFVARRRGWVEIRIAPSSEAVGGALDRVALERLADKVEDLENCYQDTLGLVQALTDIRQHKSE